METQVDLDQWTLVAIECGPMDLCGEFPVAWVQGGSFVPPARVAFDPESGWCYDAGKPYPVMLTSESEAALHTAVQAVMDLAGPGATEGYLSWRWSGRILLLAPTRMILNGATR